MGAWGNWLAAGLLACGVAIGIAVAFGGRGGGRKVRKGDGRARLAAADWREFETLTADALTLSGFAVAENPGGEAGPDGGVDVVAEKGGRRYAVQCKCWRREDVGVPVVRETFGAMAARGDDACMVACVGEFSRAAVAWARGKPVYLLDGRALARMLDGRSFESVIARPSGAEAREERRRARMGGGVSCPGCGAEMVLRRVRRRGRGADREFWGCVRYPECKATRPA